MVSGFKYRKPTGEALQRRATQSIGSFEGFINDEYPKYTAKKGENAVRILPRHADEEAEYYGEEVHIHYNVGPDKASVLCLNKMLNKPCPVCEDRMKAERRGDDEAVKAMRPQRRVIMWIIDRKEENKGPQVWDCPPTVDKEVTKTARDRERGIYEALDDPEQGKDIYFDRDGEGLTTKYTGFQLAKRPTSVEDKWLVFITKNPLKETLRWRSYDEVSALFEGRSATGETSERRHEEQANRRPSVQREPERSDTGDDGLEKDAAFLQEQTSGASDDKTPPWEEQGGGGKNADPPREQSSTMSGAERAKLLKERYKKA